MFTFLAAIFSLTSSFSSDTGHLSLVSSEDNSFVSISEQQLTMRSEKGPLIVKAFEELSSVEAQSWIAHAAIGYDTAVIVLAKGVEGELRAKESGYDLYLHRSPSVPYSLMTMGGERAYRLAKGRLLMDAYDTEEALEIFEQVYEEYPEDSDVILSCARCHLQYGRPMRAYTFIDRAQRFDPDQQVVQDLLRELRWRYDPYLAFEQDIRRIKGESSEQRTRISGETVLSCDGCSWLMAQAVFDYDNIKVANLVQLDGSYSGEDTDRYIAQVGLSYHWECGSNLIGTLYTTGETYGGAVQLYCPCSYGEWVFRTDINRPTWDFTGAIIHYGSYSGLSVAGVVHCSYRMVMTGGIGCRRYRAKDYGKVADAVPFNFNTTYLIYNNLCDIRLSYSIASLYGFDHNRSIDSSGTPYDPLAFTTYEIHNGSVIVGKGDISGTWYGEVYGGIGYDRYRSGGPAVGAQGFYRIDECWELGATAQHAKSTSGISGSSDLTRFVIALKRVL